MSSLLEEDDCAPDARHYFEEEFHSLTGERIHHFKMLAAKKHTDTGTTWTRNGYELSYDCTYPFYVLKKVL